MITTKDSIEPASTRGGTAKEDGHSSEQLPKSKRVYIAGELHPDVRVPMREIELMPTKGFQGRIEVNIASGNFAGASRDGRD